jgi:hypothetical protein
MKSEIIRLDNSFKYERAFVELIEKIKSDQSMVIVDGEFGIFNDSLEKTWFEAQLKKHIKIIEIIKIPLGLAPEEVRAEWVGLQLPAVQLPDWIKEKDPISGMAIPRAGSFAVPLKIGLAILKQKSIKAFDWFKNSNFINYPSFDFGIDEVVVVSEAQQLDTIGNEK